MLHRSFGWNDFGEDEKKRVKNRRENRLERCLAERGRRREKWWSPTVLSLNSPKLNFFKMRRK